MMKLSLVKSGAVPERDGKNTQLPLETSKNPMFKFLGTPEKISGTRSLMLGIFRLVTRGSKRPSIGLTAIWGQLDDRRLSCARFDLRPCDSSKSDAAVQNQKSAFFSDGRLTADRA